MSTSQLMQEIALLEDSVTRKQEELSETLKLRSVVSKQRDLIQQLRMDNAHSCLQIQKLQTDMISNVAPPPEYSCENCTTTNENYENLKEFCVQLEQELEDLQAQPPQPDPAVFGLELRIKELEGDIKERDERLKQTSEQIEFLLKQVSELESFKLETEELRAETLRLKQEQGVFISELSESQMRLSGVRAQLQESEVSVSRVDEQGTFAQEYERIEQLDEMRTSLSARESEVHMLKEQLHDSVRLMGIEKELARSCGEEAKALRTQNAQLRTSAGAENAQLAQINLLHTQLNAAEERIGVLEAQLETAKEPQHDEDNAVEQLVSEIATLKEQLAEQFRQNGVLKQQLIAQYVTANERHEALTSKNQQATVQIAELASQIDEFRRNDETEVLIEANKQLEQALTLKQEQLQAEFDKAATLARELQKSTEYIQQCEEEREATQSDMQALLNDQSEGIAKIKELTENCAEATEAVEELKKENYYLMTENEALKEQIEIDQLVHEVEEEAHSTSENEI